MLHATRSGLSSGVRSLMTASNAASKLSSRSFSAQTVPSSSFVRIIEVGPRDGLQNEKTFIETDVKIDLINKLSEAGLQTVEATSFVSPKWVPQMKDASQVLKGITRHPGVNYPVLTPNIKGFEGALEGGAEEVAVFASATESFSQKNIGCSIEESMKRFDVLMAAAKESNIRVRGYVSCVLGCPYEGKVDKNAVVDVVDGMLTMGCYEISLGDTIGIGNPKSTDELLEAIGSSLSSRHPNLKEQLAVHFHNTYGMALANIAVALRHGITRVDSSVAGLGGCPYAKGATGNVATEDVVYMLHEMGYETGIDLEALMQAGDFITSKLGIESRSMVARALAPKRKAKL